MTDKVQLIRQKIERLKSQAHTIPNLGINSLAGFLLACDDVIALIDSLPEEHNEDLEEEIERCWKEMFPNGWSDYTLLTLTYDEHKAFARHFAEWQKQQMMKNAVETTIVNDWQYGKDPDHAIIPAIHQRIERLDVGDKAKIIIVKEEQQ